MKNILYLTSIFILCVCFARADEEFNIPKQDIVKTVDTIALVPSENIIWQSLNELYDTPWEYEFRHLVKVGILKPNNYIILKDTAFIKRTAYMTDSLIYQKFSSCPKLCIIPQAVSKANIERILRKLDIGNVTNVFTGNNKNVVKSRIIPILIDSLEVDAVMIPSYQLAVAVTDKYVAKWDGYSERCATISADIVSSGARRLAFSMVSILLDRSCDTLWVGRYGMRLLNDRTTGENIFETDRIKNAVNNSYKKLLKQYK